MNTGIDLWTDIYRVSTKKQRFAYIGPTLYINILYQRLMYSANFAIITTETLLTFYTLH